MPQKNDSENPVRLLKNVAVMGGDIYCRFIWWETTRMKAISGIGR
jgi:hypothetical protein